MSSTETRNNAGRAASTPGRPDRGRGADALVSGWGRSAPTRARVLRPHGSAELVALMRTGQDGGAIPRGAGRSYGDPAQNEAGAVLDMTALTGVHGLDAGRQEVRVAAGTSFAALLESLARQGLTLPVVPGTRHLTVGGAIAADVHGKNHPAGGSVAHQLVSFELVVPGGETLEVTRAGDAELFAATTGGMGLTGAIAAATLRTVPLREPFAIADIDRADAIEDAMALMDGGGYTHAIAWLDLLASGGRFGRAVVTRSREGDARPSPGRSGSHRRRRCAFRPERPVACCAASPCAPSTRRSGTTALAASATARSGPSSSCSRSTAWGTGTASTGGAACCSTSSPCRAARSG